MKPAMVRKGASNLFGDFASPDFLGKTMKVQFATKDKKIKLFRIYMTIKSSKVTAIPFSMIMIP